MSMRGERKMVGISGSWVLWRRPGRGGRGFAARKGRARSAGCGGAAPGPEAGAEPAGPGAYSFPEMIVAACITGLSAGPKGGA